METRSIAKVVPLVLLSTPHLGLAWNSVHVDDIVWSTRDTNSRMWRWWSCTSGASNEQRDVPRWCCGCCDNTLGTNGVAEVLRQTCRPGTGEEDLQMLLIR